MAQLSLNLPVVNELVTAADPKVATCLTEIQTQINGKIEAVNLASNAVTTEKIKEQSVTGEKVAVETIPGTKMKGTEFLNGAYGAQVEQTFGAEIEPSKTRPTFVMLEVQFGGTTGERGFAALQVGGVQICQVLSPSLTGFSATQSISFICPAAVKYKVVNGANGVKFFSSILTL